MSTSPSPPTPAHFAFPAPVGGVPQPADLAPSILFVIIYAFLVPLVVFRMIRPERRSFVTFNAMFFSIERVVLYALRAQESHKVSAATSSAVVRYTQSTLGTSYLGICQDLVMILRVWLVHSTQGQVREQTSDIETSDPKDQEIIVIEAGSLGSDQHPAPSETSQPPATYSTCDNPQKRALIRRWTGIAALLFLTAQILGIVAGAIYTQGEKSESRDHLIQSLRYASAGMGLALLIGFIVVVLWAIMTIPTLARSSGCILSTASFLMAMVAVYRLIVMQFHTTSLESTAKNAQNEPESKAFFYIFHVVPEWLSVALLLSVNVRRRFNAGLFGDFRRKDKA